MTNTPIREVSTHIIFPTVRHMIGKLIHDLGLQEVIGNSIFIKGDGMASSTDTDEDGNARLSDDRLTAEYEVVIDPYSVEEEVAKSDTPRNIRPSMLLQESKQPFFADDSILTRCVVHRQPMQITINTKLSFTDRVIAYDAYTRLMDTYTFGTMQTYLDIPYDYPIPRQVFGLLYTLADMKGLPGDKFIDYMNKYTAGNFTLNVNRDDMEVVEPIIRDNACRVLMKIKKGSEKPEANKDSTTAKTYDIPLTMTIQMDRPSSIFTIYPIAVNNELVPAKWVFENPEDAYAVPNYIHRSFLIQDGVETLPEVGKEEPYRVPWYDLWKYPDAPLKNKGYFPIAIIHFTLDDVDNPDGYTEIDVLGDLGGLRLDPEIVIAIKQFTEPPTEFNGLYNVSVYSNFKILGRESIEWVDNKLRVLSRDKTKVYRLLISEYSGVTTNDSTVYTLSTNIAYCKGYVEPGVPKPVKYMKYIQSDKAIIKYILGADDNLYIFAISSDGVYRCNEETDEYTQVFNDDETPVLYKFAQVGFNNTKGLLISPDEEVVVDVNNKAYAVDMDGDKLIHIDQRDVVNYTKGVNPYRKFNIVRRGVKYGKCNVIRVMDIEINGILMK